jgi:hypothetical protein
MYIIPAYGQRKKAGSTPRVPCLMTFPARPSHLRWQLVLSSHPGFVFPVRLNQNEKKFNINLTVRMIIAGSLPIPEVHAGESEYSFYPYWETIPIG